MTKVYVVQHAVHTEGGPEMEVPEVFGTPDAAITAAIEYVRNHDVDSSVLALLTDHWVLTWTDSNGRVRELSIDECTIRAAPEAIDWKAQYEAAQVCIREQDAVLKAMDEYREATLDADKAWETYNKVSNNPEAHPNYSVGALHAVWRRALQRKKEARTHLSRKRPERSW